MSNKKIDITIEQQAETRWIVKVNGSQWAWASTFEDAVSILQDYIADMKGEMQ